MFKSKLNGNSLVLGISVIMVFLMWIIYAAHHWFGLFTGYVLLPNLRTRKPTLLGVG